mmetsp:Transcript_14237/g.26870  ORF Transcript_14237/g.26870 Transcript_14237/m.26870 type:complete len:297 (-) Transcript_14237:3816-4706(-)
MDFTPRDEIVGISVGGYEIKQGLSGYVVYKLSVVGSTNYLHPMAYFDRHACVPLEKPLYCFKARYSYLLRLHLSLVSEVRGKLLPSFPPKRWVRNRSDSVIRDRISHLNRYFASLLTLDYVRTSFTLNMAFRPQISLNYVVIGCPDVGKTSFVDGFVDLTPSQRHSRIEMSPEKSQIFSVHRPIDLVVDRVIVRIEGIELLSINPSDSLSSILPALSEYDGVILAYSAVETQEPVQLISKHLKQPFTFVNLGCGDSYLLGSESADYNEEAYLIFDQLTRRCVNAQIRRHRRCVSTI